MEGQIEEADRIIAVCTPDYSARASRDAAAGVGLGPSWEWNFIRREVYEMRGEASRIVSVWFVANWTASVPVEVGDRPRHDAASEVNYLTLLIDLFGRAGGPVEPVDLGRSEAGGVAPAASVADSSKARADLKRLLLALVDLCELRRFADYLQVRDQLRTHLRSGRSLADGAHDLVAHLHRRRQIDGAPFEVLS